ncbi:TPA: hypothetical protein ACHF2V_004231 [Citrobacter farmeri]|jgi:hypothetical protein|uniref:hypothetical protein n=1 Tax=Enterobacteriaceae TaxID=543 RepID=UPI0005736120|nr:MULTISPECIES: hypothetical protein [Enterobacteriaceae]ECZ5331826.1 hypothetical protein [Salmonella enterica subsp. enterica serovar Senftenberg]EFA9630712.1 hypothetical protein [Escherichia coli]EHN8807728.1 hypothetical protein [Enterobacter roggenkampii]EKC2282134.1 hypothetical protein [Salmonella enterica]MBJ3560839.1 hypothetical protein [Salmonella enterica subsp. enterica serovar Derby]OIR47508.1 hypothetical protein BH716_00435 [Lelliottia nimipressuralis]
MRNRSHTPPKDEAAFIHGGSAALSSTEELSAKKHTAGKAKPVSISLADENLRAIDDVIRDEMLSGRTRVNRSDVVRAALMALDRLTKEELSQLIEKAKLK